MKSASETLELLIFLSKVLPKPYKYLMKNKFSDLAQVKPHYFQMLSIKIRENRRSVPALVDTSVYMV